MKIQLLLILFLILSISVFGQNDEPNEIYNKAGNKLIGINYLMNCDGNGKQSFRGSINNIKSFAESSIIYFEIGKTSFELKYENMSNVGRSNLNGLIKRNNFVSIYGCAGGSNGIWGVINIFQANKSSKKKKLMLDFSPKTIRVDK